MDNIVEGQIITKPDNQNKSEIITEKVTSISASEKKTDETDLKQFLFHPISVIVMMVLDWGGLLIEIPESFAPPLLLVSAIFIFAIAFTITYFLQINFGKDSPKEATNKALLSGILCAIPFPIMSTSIGAIILTMSGMNAVNEKGIDGLIEMFKKQTK
jgi:hypothetical protein